MLQPNLTQVKPMEGFKLKLTYETGEEKLFDVAPYMEGSWYSELQDTAYFNRVRLLEDGYGIEWPNGQDIAPHELYEMSKRLVRAWDSDFTKVTPEEATRIQHAKESGFVPESEIDWNNLNKY